MLAVPVNHIFRSQPYVSPSDLANQVLITYPVDRNRLDIFIRFLDLEGIEPEHIRTAELTPVMVQLVANGRGVASLPNWALTEYLERQTVDAVPLGDRGLWSTLFAAIREDQLSHPFIEDFILTSKETCFHNLAGIKVV